MSGLTTSAVWVRGIVEMLGAEGLDAGALLAEAGIDRPTIEVSDGRLATEKISRLWELAVARSGDPSIGLAQHDVVRPAIFGVVGYTMMSCADLHGAFERLVRYLRILSDALTIHLAQERGGYVAAFQLSGGDRPVPRQRIDFIFITLVNFLRWVSGREVHPIAVQMTYPAPVDPARYRDAFRCPVAFDAPVNALLFSPADMTRPLPTSNRTLAELHERFAGEYLERFDHAQVSYRVREVIIRRLPDGEPRRDRVARELCMSERTLQRRLEDESTSFLRLLDDTRRELAAQHLGRLHLSLGEAAYLLGFADQSSFFRACRRWFGLPPGEYRRLSGAAAAAEPPEQVR
jgi:AraC-like DNA-binding protein